MKLDLIQVVENINEDRGFPEIYPGDYVRVHVTVIEGNKSRVQVFHGTVIRDSGNGQNRTFTVRRVASHGIGVERTFLYKSPRIEKIEIVRHNKVRRAQLYYMRNLRGKAARLEEVREVNRNKPKHKNVLKQQTEEAVAAMSEDARRAEEDARRAEEQAAAKAEAEAAAAAEATEAEAETSDDTAEDKN